MATAKVRIGTQIPYGTLAKASAELRNDYYYYNVESKLPPLPEVPPEQDSYEQNFCSKHDSALLYELIFPRLRGKSRQVIYMRYWLDMSTREVARNLDLSNERVRQIEMHALRNLRSLILQANICRQPLHRIPSYLQPEYAKLKKDGVDIRLGEFWYYLEA